ncbi:hypothetical protein C2857_001927 [Epichloe festucae Fl1]|uniref:CFEM domain-containing protein n=1 Tax=Epichloe festucae (strain Fl1) TaxID=877507 RepID=A0A7S9KRN6_EPIFF|nr:hypothetical protein C2857_001927 [Epichloe festucae Fl1]
MALAAGFAAAQLDQLDKIPKCAYSCITSHITGTDIAGCKPADIACVCNNKDFISSISCCLEKDCQKDDIQSTIKFASGICNASGVKTPTELVCNKNAASSGASTSTAASRTQNGSGTGTGTATATTSTQTATATKTNAAAPVYVNAGGVLGVVLAVAAVL